MRTESWNSLALEMSHLFYLNFEYFILLNKYHQKDIKTETALNKLITEMEINIKLAEMFMDNYYLLIIENIKLLKENNNLKTRLQKLESEDNK
ncbi:MAG: hypothetical protein RSB50_05340 [Cetobacterium sp.]